MQQHSFELNHMARISNYINTKTEGFGFKFNIFKRPFELICNR